MNSGLKTIEPNRILPAADLFVIPSQMIRKNKKQNYQQVLAKFLFKFFNVLPQNFLLRVCS